MVDILGRLMDISIAMGMESAELIPVNAPGTDRFHRTKANFYKVERSCRAIRIVNISRSVEHDLVLLVDIFINGHI